MTRRPPAALLILATLVAAPAARAQTAPDQAAPAHRVVVVRKAVSKSASAPVLASGDVFGAAVLSRPSNGFSEAPVPNDEIAPQVRPLSTFNTEPKLFTMKTEFRGDGYPYGATPQGLDDKYQVQVPGVDVTLPLVQ